MDSVLVHVMNDSTTEVVVVGLPGVPRVGDHVHVRFPGMGAPYTFEAKKVVWKAYRVEVHV